MKKKKDVKWRNSIQTRQIIGFSIITLFMMVSTAMLQLGAMKMATEMTYDKMDANAEYFLESFENEVSHVHQLQLDFFNDRKLTFLESPEINLSEYERREALLSVKERLQTVTGVSRLIKDGILCLPESDYWITPTGIRRISSENQERLEEYLQYGNGKVHFNGSEYFIVESSTVKSQAAGLPRHILIITFSPEAVRENMAALNTVEDTGAFFYLEENDYLLASRPDDGVEREICGKLKRGEDGEYLSVQRIKIHEDWYLVATGGIGDMGLFVQYTKEASVMEAIDRFRDIMMAVIGVMILMAVVFILYLKKLIHQPIKILLEAFSNLEKGNWSTDIRHEENDEFGQLYEGFNKMKDRIGSLIEEVYVQTNLAQRAQLKQLQAQINPHFLYNSFFILSRRIKRGDDENAQIIAEHLGEYFRFLTRNESDYIPLRKEVEHARCYANIQAARFVSRIAIEFGELPEEAGGLLVPRLILQPLLENVFEHGLYNKMEHGLVRVSFTEDGESLLIAVEDNGEELADEDIDRMRESLGREDDGEITGVINIHKRLKYYFKGHGGLMIDRSCLGGLKVTICLYRQGEDDGAELTDCR